MRGTSAMRGQKGGEVAKQGTCLKHLTARPSLSITLHSHIGHNNKLPSWLTGGQVNAFSNSLKDLALNIHFPKMGTFPEVCAENDKTQEEERRARRSASCCRYISILSFMSLTEVKAWFEIFVQR